MLVVAVGSVASCGGTSAVVSPGVDSTPSRSVAVDVAPAEVGALLLTFSGHPSAAQAAGLGRQILTDHRRAFPANAVYTAGPAHTTMVVTLVPGLSTRQVQSLIDAVRTSPVVQSIVEIADDQAGESAGKTG